MFLRKFLNGRISPLTMSGAGADAGGGAGGGGGGDAAAAAAAAAAAGAGAGAGAGDGKAWSFPTEKAFAEYIPEKYRADASLRDIKDFDGLVSGFVNAQKMIGADKGTIVQLPKDGDAAAEAAFFNRLGRPETADKYALGKKPDGSDYTDGDKAMQSKLLPVLHEAGLTQKQLDKIRPAWDGLMAEAASASSKAAETYATEQQGKLKTELGAAYDQTLSDAQAAIVHYGSKELLEQLNIVKDGKATGDNAEVIKLFGKMGRQLREDGVLKGDGGGQSPGALSPGEAKQQISAKQQDEKFMASYRDKADPGHKEAVAAMSRLYSFAYPEPQD